MITTVSSSAALATALKNAHGGDTILLAAGSYDAVALSGLNFSQAVTIRSADSAHEAVINGLTVRSSSGLSFDHIDFAANGGTAVTVSASQNIAFDSIQQHGAALGDGNGMMIRDSSGIVVTNSDIGKLGTGINELNSQNLTITGNTFHDISSGDIRGTGVVNETISGNHFLNAKAGVTNHGDVISLWQDNTANHVTISDTNTFGAGGTTTATQPATPVVTAPPPPVTSPPPVSSPPPTTTHGSVTVSNSAALATALNSAHAGDTILLSAGTYSAVNLSGLNFSQAVTIQSADSAHEAVINGLTLKSSSGLAFNHIDFAANGGTAVTVSSSQNIAFDSVRQHGAALGDGNGMMIRDSSGVAVTNSDIGKLGTGINELNSQNLTITGNTFHDISSGDIRGTGVVNETISGNHFLDAKAGVANHGDVISLWQDNAANHVTISDTNTFGAGGTTTTTQPTTPVVTAPPPVTSPPPVSSPSGAETGGHTVTVSSSDALWTALKSAHGGDTILLAPGSYSPISLDQFRFDGTVTVQSADNSHQAVLSGLTINHSSGLAFNNVDIPVVTGMTAVTVGNSDGISLSGFTIHGTAAAPTGLGMMVRTSTDVTVSNSSFTGLGSGIGHQQDQGLAIVDNTFHNLQVDGIVGGGSSRVLVDGNSFDTFHPLAGNHPDAIQFFAANGVHSSDITIKDNVITRGDGDPIQGIFIENTDNIIITGSAMTGTLYNGIAVSGSTKALIADNFLQGFQDISTRIITRGMSSDVTVQNNASQTILNYQDNGHANPNYVQIGNTTVGATAAGNLSQVNDWLSHHSDASDVALVNSWMSSHGYASSDWLAV